MANNKVAHVYWFKLLQAAPLGQNLGATRKGSEELEEWRGTWGAHFLKFLVLGKKKIRKKKDVVEGISFLQVKHSSSGQTASEASLKTRPPKTHTHNTQHTPGVRNWPAFSWR